VVVVVVVVVAKFIAFIGTQNEYHKHITD
jgi:hypothetical protein